MTAVRIRFGLGTLGVLVAAYGCWLLFSRQDATQLTNAGEWFVAGILLHDGLIAPVVVAGGWLATLRMPIRLRGAAAMFLIIAGPITLIAIPVFEDKSPDGANPTINARDYLHGWVEVLAVVLVIAVGWMLRVWLAQRRTSRVEGKEEDGDVPRTRRR